MNVIIYGFDPEISRYRIQELYQYLLVFGALMVVAGRFLSRRRIDRDYFCLIRHGCVANWWHKQVYLTVMLGVAETAALFLAAVLWFWVTDAFTGRENWQQDMGVAFFLWLIGLITIHLLQLILIQFKNGEKFSFLFIIIMEAISLYYVSFPGSFLMVRRSSLMTAGGFSIGIAAALQLILDVGIGWQGYRLLVRKGARTY